ncbi:hypothetical protein K7X08_037809 [Anisodus acutangulus]|uniref:Uncharacterized protein n=1 Tax=Anisodus acutangulus TaxID=402998 RepID=A0A9Q1RPR4_9SOLA|nr:hypothetical protein K7X08_037809 [Anisodus acutangulus]
MTEITKTLSDITVEADAPKPPSPWTNLFSKNRLASNGLVLNYVAPEVIEGKILVEVDKQEIESEAMKWKASLIAYVVGDTPSYKHMSSGFGQKERPQSPGCQGCQGC